MQFVIDKAPKEALVHVMLPRPEGLIKCKAMLEVVSPLDNSWIAQLRSGHKEHAFRGEIPLVLRGGI
jgi:hypothetical protein